MTKFCCAIFKVVTRLASRWLLVNSLNGETGQCHALTGLQREMFVVLNRYQVGIRCSVQ